MAGLGTLIVRGARRRCPRCGKDPIFETWATLRERCRDCGLEIRSREEDTWFLMYMSTAAITGLFVIAMLLIRPRSLLLGRIGIGVTALLVFLVTNPIRKGIAIALDYYVDTRSEHPRHGV
jgi:uncharacterized protein (DUF983 family)